nr:uncharacterized protein LOC109190924 [Ipomoea trifida]
MVHGLIRRSCLAGKKQEADDGDVNREDERLVFLFAMRNEKPVKEEEVSMTLRYSKRHLSLYMSNTKYLGGLGLRDIIVESDSKRVIQVLMHASRMRGNSGNVINRCFGLTRRFANVQFRNVFREQNRVADSLAKQALSLPIGLTTVAEPPGELRDWIREDQMGARFNRQSPLQGDGLALS